MLPPYETREVAEAVRDRARRAELSVRRVLVGAHDRFRVWTVVLESDEGPSRSARLPFSTPEGITTPGEIAREVVNGEGR